MRLTAACVVGVIAAACLFPDLLIMHKQGFVWAHDPESPMHNVFALISQWSHGGVALFDRFDQINGVYIQLTSGMYGLINVTLAAIYLLCSPLFSLPAEAFHHFYAFGFHALTIVLRTVGGYLLLRRLGIRMPVIIIALAMLNTLLSMPMYFGLLTNSLYSYLLLLVYFIWVFFEKFDVRYLLAALLVLTTAIANSPEYAMGYFYMCVHFFIISCIVLSFVNGTWRNWAKGWEQVLRQRWAIVLVLTVAGLIMLPWAWMFKLLSHDFFIDGSGMDGTAGRLNNILNPLKYFAPGNQHSSIPLRDFVPGILNFTDNRWDSSWPFIGWGTAVFSLAGLLCSAHRAKWVFAGTIALIVLANAPVQLWSIWSIAHWINAFTNPFSFLLRSFHMPVLLMPVLFLPLMALGMQALWDTACRRGSCCKAMAAGFIALVCAADFAMAWVYARQYPPADRKIVAPRICFALAGFQPLILDYQNPLHLPFREYIRAQPIPVNPPIHSSQNLYGLFYKYTPFERYLREPNIYDPLPMAYKDFYRDHDEQGHNFTEYYLNQDTRWMFLADAAIDTHQLSWPMLLGLHLERRIALVEGVKPGTSGVLARPQDYVWTDQPLPAPRIQLFSFDLNGAQKQNKEDFVQYDLKLPAVFPAYVASGLFTRDREALALAVDGRSLLPVQGKIVHPFEFDVNNMHQGHLFLSLPLEFHAGGKPAVLTLKQSGEILDVWRNEYDNIGIIYLAVKDGWLVIHLPYDPRWRITIDGTPAAVYRTNRYFLGTPITQGKHKILLQYWPGSPLRPLIVLSVMLTYAALIGVVMFGLRCRAA